MASASASASVPPVNMPDARQCGSRKLCIGGPTPRASSFDSLVSLPTSAERYQRKTPTQAPTSTAASVAAEALLQEKGLSEDMLGALKT